MDEHSQFLQANALKLQSTAHFLGDFMNETRKESQTESRASRKGKQKIL